MADVGAARLMGEIETLSGGDETLDHHIARHSIDRLIMLCDGVFAIAITLAAVEIHVPDGPTLGAVLGQMGVRLTAYAISFLVIAVFWTSNRDMFARLRRIDKPLTILVLLQLCLVALIPAAVRITGPGHGGLGGAFAFYALVMTASGTVNFASSLYAALRPGIMAAEVPRAYRLRRAFETVTLPLLFGALVIAPDVVTLRWVALGAVALIAARRLLVRWVS